MGERSAEQSIRGLDGRLRLTPLQRRIIETLRRRDGWVRPWVDLSFQGALRTNVPGMSKAINKLRAKGLVEVSWHKGEGTVLRLTEEGKTG